MREAIFLIQCTDRKGLLAEISAFFYGKSFNILQCRQYTDIQENRYFMRIRLDLSDMAITRSALERDFAGFAAGLKLDYSIHYREDLQKVAILVSKTSHCLY
ncbi:MAG: formyltetrahydrofolate deformylase, partial [Syntrophobacteraceae bacterium CG07_land_8_20_14_0_80_61_8]